jgi:hypothetical protein
MKCKKAFEWRVKMDEDKIITALYCARIYLIKLKKKQIMSVNKIRTKTASQQKYKYTHFIAVIKTC